MIPQSSLKRQDIVEKASEKLGEKEQIPINDRQIYHFQLLKIGLFLDNIQILEKRTFHLDYHTQMMPHK